MSFCKRWWRNLFRLCWCVIFFFLILFTRESYSSKRFTVPAFIDLILCSFFFVYFLSKRNRSRICVCIDWLSRLNIHIFNEKLFVSYFDIFWYWSSDVLHQHTAYINHIMIQCHMFHSIRYSSALYWRMLRCCWLKTQKKRSRRTKRKRNEKNNTTKYFRDVTSKHYSLHG